MPEPWGVQRVVTPPWPMPDTALSIVYNITPYGQDSATKH